MTFSPLPLIALGLAAASAACDGVGPGDCTHDARPAIELYVRDARTGAYAGDGARGVVRDGAYVDSLRPSIFAPGGPVQALSAADERPGTYEVRLERAGYEPWAVSGVRVRRDECHVQTAQLTAHLQPTP